MCLHSTVSYPRNYDVSCYLVTTRSPRDSPVAASAPRYLLPPEKSGGDMKEEVSSSNKFS